MSFLTITPDFTGATLISYTCVVKTSFNIVDIRQKKIQHKGDTVSPAETKKHTLGDDPFSWWRLKDQPSVFAHVNPCDAELAFCVLQL